MTPRYTVSLPLSCLSYSAIHLQQLISGMYHFLYSHGIVNGSSGLHAVEQHQQQSSSAASWNQQHLSSPNARSQTLNSVLQLEFYSSPGSAATRRPPQQNFPQKENLSFSCQSFQNASHVLFHFNSKYLAKKVWEEYNAKWFCSGGSGGIGGIWAENDVNFRARMGFQSSSPSASDCMQLEMTLILEDEEDSSNTNNFSSTHQQQQQQQQNPFSQSNHHLNPPSFSQNQYDNKRKRKRDLFANSAHPNQDSSMDNLTDTLHSLMTPCFKRRRRAKSLDAIDTSHPSASMSNNTTHHMQHSTNSTPFAASQMDNSSHNMGAPSNFSTPFGGNTNNTSRQTTSTNNTPFAQPSTQQNNSSQQRTPRNFFNGESKDDMFLNTNLVNNSFNGQTPRSQLTSNNQNNMCHSAPPAGGAQEEQTPFVRPTTPTRKRGATSLRRQRAYSPPPMDEKYAKILKIDNLSDSTTEEDVRRALSKYGSWNIEWIKVVGRDNSMKKRAFVLFEHSFETMEAKNMVHFRLFVDSMVSCGVATQSDFFWLQKHMNLVNNNASFPQQEAQQNVPKAYQSMVNGGVGALFSTGAPQRRRLFDDDDENMGDSDEDCFGSVRQPLFNQQQ